MAADLDKSYDDLSSFVCEHGPNLLTRGMPPFEANTAIMACLSRLYNRLALAERIIDALPSYSVGESFMSEEDIEPMMEEWNARNR